MKETRQTPRRRVLVFKQLQPEKGIPYTRQHLGRLERRGLFPKRIRVGPNRVGWLEDELDEHVERAADARESA
jgi:prophage regulatory protein